MAGLKFVVYRTGRLLGVMKDWEIWACSEKEMNKLLDRFNHQIRFSPMSIKNYKKDFKSNIGLKLDVIEEPIDGGSVRYLFRKCLCEFDRIGPVTEWGLGHWYSNFCDGFLENCWEYMTDD